MLPPLDDFLAAQQKRDDGLPVGKPFKAGEGSANPGGRPKRLAALALKIAEFDDEAQQILQKIARGGKGIKAGEQVQAIRLMWSYAHGNPVQAVTGPDGEGLKLGVVILPAEDAQP